MFRYLGPILIVVMALGLVAGIAVILVGPLAGRLAADPALCLTVFDGIGAVGGDPPRIRAVIGGSEPGRPAKFHWLVARFQDGSSAWAWIRPDGLSRTVAPRGLTTGAYRFVVGLPEVQPRLDVSAAGTVYVWPQSESVIWFDAAAIVPACGVRLVAECAAGGRSGEVLDIVDAVKTLASGRLPVYLVSADAQGYASARRRLKAYGAPPGPAFWVIPGKERSRLLGLKGVWPHVHAAVVCDPIMGEAAARAGVTVREAPSADALSIRTRTGPGPAETRRAWRRILENLTARRAGDGNVRR